jgi:hypothetical protein
MNLQRLGHDLEAIAPSGSIADLDEKMCLYKWNPTQRTALKLPLRIVGAIA